MRVMAKRGSTKSSAAKTPARTAEKSKPINPPRETTPKPIESTRGNGSRIADAVSKVNLPRVTETSREGEAPAEPTPSPRTDTASAGASGSRIAVPDTPVPPPEIADPVLPPIAPGAVHAPLPAMLFEVAWEVCWQLGGIYTVLRSKAQAMINRWDDRYVLIGPYNPATAALEFEEMPTEGVIRETLDRLRNAGIACHYGRWLVPGRPKVILLDYRGRYSHLDADKFLMWKDHGIGTYASDGEVNEVIAFGFTVAQFFQELSSLMTDRPILAHFHEWMGGVAVPRITHLRLPVTTVFTTHATLLGRYLAGDNPYFYDHLPYLNGDDEARKYNILPRHQIEKAAAHASTVFTTVSEVTAREAEQLLQRRPDAILPNGLSIHRFAALHEFQNLHRQYKERIHEFVMGHFFPSYTFDLDRTIYLVTSGRYEYRNKGLDLFIESMAKLNERLKSMSDPPTVIAFIITRAATRNINIGVLQSQAMFDELRNTCADVEKQMGRKLFIAAATGRMPTYNELMPDDATVRLKRAMHVWRSNRQPLIVTHDLVDDANDAVLKHIRHRGLFNAPDDPVKIVFHPEFLTATSPLINLDYDNFVRGCHMGVFPSYYEPWGYTPMECVALGVPAVTTDLSGFGAYVQRHVDYSQQQGVFVLRRREQGFDQSTEDLTNYLFDFARLTRRQRIELRNRVERLSELFDWSVLARHYHEAHDLALERTLGLRPGKLETKVV
jgi:glycogen(starch) synthase